MPSDFKRFGDGPTAVAFNIGKWSFSIREIVLAVVAVILFIIFLVFAGLYGQTQNELASKPKAEASVGQGYCTSDSCLKTAAHVTSLMNKSVDPCDNFYQYACGNFDNVKPYLPNARDDRTILMDMFQLNNDRLVQVLEKPIDAKHEDSAERKLKEFYQSCNDMYEREKHRGVPFLKKVIPELGGWSVLGTFDNSTWDFNSALKKVHAEFWRDAFFSMVSPFATGGNIYLRDGGLSDYIPTYWYLVNLPIATKYRNDYKKFIRGVGSLLARDAHDLMDPKLSDVSTREAHLNDFVNDVYIIETKLARAIYDRKQRVDTMTLSELNSYTGNVIDYVDVFSYFYQTAGVTKDKTVFAIDKNYFRNVSNLINSLPADNRNRMLNNYIIWRVAEDYAKDLSWEYIHANRELFEDFYGIQSFAGLNSYCYRVADGSFLDVLSALYVQDFLDEESNNKIHDITYHLQKTLASQIDQITWFDDATKKYAKSKLDAVVFQMGFHEGMKKWDLIDATYTGLTINITDFFGNLLNTRKLLQGEWNQQVINPKKREDWRLRTYAVGASYFKTYNMIVATAGVLQLPIYDKTLPHYYTFGSIGSMLGLFLYHAVDEYGQMYDREGKLLDTSWWTNQTATNYKPVSQCVNELLKNVTIRTTHPLLGYQLQWHNGLLLHKTEFIAFVLGIRLAQKAYIDWMASPDRVAEKMLPGVDLTEEQMIYLSHTQAYCQSASHSIEFSGEAVNTFAMGELSEFSKAFNCKKGSKMNPAKRCDYN